MGRKENSVPVNSERIESRRKEKGYSKASLAREIGYSREAVTRSINNGYMDIGMLEHIAKALDCYPTYLQGTYDGDSPHSDYEFDRKWAVREEYFTKFLKLCEDEIIVRDVYLPAEYRNVPHNYSLKDFIEEYDLYYEDLPVLYDADGLRLSESAYGYLAVEVIEFLGKYLAKIFVENLNAKEAEEGE